MRVMAGGRMQSGSDGTDVNALDRSKNEKYIVTVDDLGLVKMFNYPCVLRDPGVRYAVSANSPIRLLLFL